jgi:hypothetical protein
MSVVDPQKTYDQTSWLTIKGPPNAIKDAQSGGIVGRTEFAGRTFSLLAAMGLGVTDLLHCGRRIGEAQFVELDLWQSSPMFDSLLLSGPRWYQPPGQDETWHNLYITWDGRRRRFDHNNLLKLGLEHPWTAHMSRGGQGLMIGQAIVGGQLQTHLTLVDYLLKEKDNGKGQLGFKVSTLTFPGNEPPRWLNPDVMHQTQTTIALFEDYCTPSDMGDTPYWETMHGDAIAAWKAKAPQYRTWYEAQVDVHTPWDFMTFCEFWAGQAGVAKGDPAKLQVRMLHRLRRHVPEPRLSELRALGEFAEKLNSA